MNHPLYQLILARVREFTREPEAMFWTYGFPLAMAIALGIAFRERPVERVSVDVAQESAEIAMHLREIKSLKVEVHPSQECLERLRTGKTDVVVNETNNGYTFHYDQAKPTSVLARTTASFSTRPLAHVRRQAMARAPRRGLEEEPKRRYARGHSEFRCGRGLLFFLLHAFGQVAAFLQDAAEGILSLHLTTGAIERLHWNWHWGAHF